MKSARASRRSVLPRIAREYPTFRSLRAARAFFEGYCVPRVIVKLSPSSFTIVPVSTARRLGLQIVRQAVWS